MHQQKQQALLSALPSVFGGEKTLGGRSKYVFCIFRLVCKINYGYFILYYFIDKYLRK